MVWQFSSPHDNELIFRWKWVKKWTFLLLNINFSIWWFYFSLLIFFYCCSCCRKSSDGSTALVYKSNQRKKVEESGYKIVGNMGDQWSDILGTNTGNRTFKLPDPMYYIAWNFEQAIVITYHRCCFPSLLTIRIHALSQYFSFSLSQ